MSSGDEGLRCLRTSSESESCSAQETLGSSVIAHTSDMPHYLDTTLYWVGCLIFLYFFVWLLTDLVKGLLFVWGRFGPTKDFVSYYGKWAVVTGSTDGIGKAYAMELAGRGLNVCLIARNENKLINVANEIKSHYSVAVKWIKADFCRTDIYDRIENELSTLDDIGILVNNVGIAPDNWEMFCNHEKSYPLNSINTNITSCVTMTQIILKRFIVQERGLIVNVGSMSSVFPLPYGAVYSSTKVFMENFTLCLRTELTATNIDVQCLRPLFVRTNLVSHMTLLKAFFDKFCPFIFPYSDEFAQSAVSTLNGYVPLYTCGHWPQSIFTTLIPSNLFSRTVWAKVAQFFMKYFWGAVTKPKFRPNNNC